MSNYCPEINATVASCLDNRHYAALQYSNQTVFTLHAAGAQIRFLYLVLDFIHIHRLTM